jgi:hypothetical protein
MEYNEAEYDHLKILNFMEERYFWLTSSQIPVELVHKYFPGIKSLHDLRVHLLQSIDRTRRLRVDNGSSFLSTCRIPSHELTTGIHVPHFAVITPPLPDSVYPIGRKPVALFPSKKRATTPKAILDILKQVEMIPSSNRKEQFTNPIPMWSKKQGHSDDPISFRELSAFEQTVASKLRAQSAPSAALKRTLNISRPESAKSKIISFQGIRTVSADPSKRISRILCPKDIIAQLAIKRAK